MRSRPAKWLVAFAGLLVGGITGTSGVLLVGSAVAQRPSTGAPAVLEATHSPPLLALPGEHIELGFDVHCAPAGIEDPEESCRVTGSVFLRHPRDERFHALPLTARAENGLRRLTALVPEDLASNRDGFEYYAELQSDNGGHLTVPSGGRDAPHRVHVLTDPIDVDLGQHAFGKPARASARVATARWGDGATDVGLEDGRNLAPIGASAFDVDPRGNVTLLDQAHRRLLQWQGGPSVERRVPVSIDGHLADIARADDGSIYVVESVAQGGRRPLIRRFDADGDELDVVEAADRTPSQIRIGPAGPVVLQQPSNQWMPVSAGDSPLSPAQQRRHARSARPLRGGDEIVVLRRDNEARLALLHNGDVRRSWRVASTTPLAEVQLAEPLGQRLVVVLRAYTDGKDEFEVLVLDRQGLAHRLSLGSADWAEAAPLGRFRLVGNALYQLGSDPTGAFVDRFDIEVR